MSVDLQPLRIGFIPLVDAAILIAAADCGFAAEEGLRLDLVREVSWANVRDRLILGQFDAAHVLAPVPIATTLGLDYARVPMVAAMALGLNGNSIVVSRALQAALAEAAEGDLGDPLVSGAAFGRVAAARRAQGEPPITLAMTFPFSTHNYQLRFWLAAAGLDPDQDVRLVVLPPPYMVEGLATGLVQGFCVGAPWPSMAVDAGLGEILHFGAEILANAPEKVLVTRESWAEANAGILARLIRACARASAWVATPQNHDELAHLLAAPGRVEVPAPVIRRVLDGRLVVAPDGRTRAHPRYIVFEGPAATRPNPTHAAWLYAQMVRWRQTSFSEQALAAAMSVYRPALFDEALAHGALASGEDGIGAFAGPAFDPTDLASHLASWSVGARPESGNLPES